jgi:hypothetical protein
VASSVEGPLRLLIRAASPALVEVHEAHDHKGSEQESLDGSFVCSKQIMKKNQNDSFQIVLSYKTTELSMTVYQAPRSTCSDFRVRLYVHGTSILVHAHVHVAVSKLLTLR